MYSLTYVSSAVRLLSTKELDSLLSKSRLNNARLGITGMLLYKNRKFMQVLEGERDTVLGLKERIAADSRHCGLVVLLDSEKPERDFEEWSMAFPYSPNEGARPFGYSKYLRTPFNPCEFDEKPVRLRQLLQMFKQHM
jgi:hypothetical protein